MSDCVREMTEIERNEYLINNIENVSCPVLLYQWEKDLVKKALRSQVSFLTYARNIGYQPTVETINNIPPIKGSSIQHKAEYQSYLTTPETKKKLAKLAEYEELEEQGLLHIAPCKNETGIFCIISDGFFHSKTIIVKDSYWNGITEHEHGKLGEEWFFTQKEAEEKIEPPYITDEEFVNYTERTSNEQTRT